jgi:hypothetical protein
MDLEKLNTKEQLEMLRQINKNYDVKLPTIEPIYDDKGEIKNEKAIKDILKQVLLIITTIWLSNKAVIDTFSKKTITNTFSYYSVYKGTKIGKTSTSWNTIINNAMKKRAEQVKIKQVIKGNITTLNKRLQTIVVDMYKSGKNKNQIAKELSRELGFNKQKAKSIAVTEVNYYKSEAQLEATKGLDVRKIWVYNPIALEPRETHIAADGQTVIGQDAYFNVGGNKTLAPQHFGLPSEDVNCHCTMRVEVIE